MNVTREQWLQAAVEAIRKDMRVVRDVTVPVVQVSCSWPGGGSPAKRIGECWPTQASKAGVNEVFISPKLEDPVKVVRVLTHELAHAVDNCVHGHKAAFTAIGRQMGMEGKPTQMEPPEAWAKAVVDQLLDTVGAFPHRSVDKSQNGQKKQSTRMLKAECGDCGAVWRMSAKHMINVTQCPCCGSDRIEGDGVATHEDDKENA
jgi:hypothetical protein